MSHNYRGMKMGRTPTGNSVTVIISNNGSDSIVIVGQNVEGMHYK